MIQKTLLVFPVFLALALSFSDKIPSAYRPMAEEVRTTCKAKSGAAEDLIEKISDGGFVEDRPLMCYMACLVEFFGWFRDDDYMDHESIIAAFPPDIRDEFAKMFLACKEIRGQDRCETAYLTNKCYYEFNPDIYFHM